MLIYKKSKKRVTLYKNILNYITKNGSKEHLKSIFINALYKASKKTGLKTHMLLSKVFKKLSSAVEVKDVNRRGKIFKIPFPISLKRQRYLSIKWFFKAVDLDKRSSAYSTKIYSELVSVLTYKKSKAVAFKIQNNKLAITNRSNIHFRW